MTDLIPEAEDRLFAMRVEWQRQKDARDRSTEWVRKSGQKMYADLTEEVSQ